MLVLERKVGQKTMVGDVLVVVLPYGLAVTAGGMTFEVRDIYPRQEIRVGSARIVPLKVGGGSLKLGLEAPAECKITRVDDRDSGLGRVGPAQDASPSQRDDTAEWPIPVLAGQ